MLKDLIKLANKLDSAGLVSVADIVDKIISKAMRGEDFNDLFNLFDGREEPIVIEEEKPVIVKEVELDEPLEELGATAPIDTKNLSDIKPVRLDALRRRHEILKLKKQKAEEQERQRQDEIRQALEEEYEDEDNKLDDDKLYEFNSEDKGLEESK